MKRFTQVIGHIGFGMRKRISVCVCALVVIASLAQGDTAKDSKEGQKQEETKKVEAGEKNIVVLGIDESTLDSTIVVGIISRNEAIINGQGSEQEKAIAQQNINALKVMEKGFPYNRKLYGVILDRLFELDVKVVALDILFVAAKEEDEAFAKTLKKYQDKVLLASTVVYASREVSDVTEAGIMTLIFPNNQLAEAVGKDNVGFAYMQINDDYKITNIPKDVQSKFEIMGHPEFAVQGDKSNEFNSFAFRAAQLYKGITSSGKEDRKIDFKPYTDKKVYTYVSLLDLFATRPGTESYNDLKKKLAGKLVFVGPAAEIFHDRHLTPVGPVDGVMIQAVVADQLMKESEAKEKGK